MKSKHHPDLNQKFLKECLHYNPLSGKFTWLERPLSHFKDARAMKITNTQKAGTIAGHSSKNKDSGKMYTRIKLSKLGLFLAHRLAFLYMEGYMPEQVDHDDSNGLNNAWSNLNRSNPDDNHRNMRKSKNNTTGVTGVYLDRRSGNYFARINHNKKIIPLGYFSNFNEAVKARRNAELQYGYHKNHGTERDL
jgi:hypothetical protein